MGTTGTTCGDHRPKRPHLRTFWGLLGKHEDSQNDDGDDVGMMWGRQGPCRDNKITKNAITFEQIEIIEFRLKIWDP